MLFRHETESTDTLPVLPLSPENGSDFRAAEPVKIAVEDYLDRVFAPLVGTMSYSERQKHRAELHQHIDSLIAAYEELGISREQAIIQALAQMGAARGVGQQWQAEQMRTMTLAQATGTATLFFGVASLLCGWLVTLPPAGYQWLIVSMIALTPFAVGWATGARAGKAAVRATINVALASNPAFWAVGASFCQWQGVKALQCAAAIGLTILADGLILGGLGAWLGSRWRIVSFSQIKLQQAR